MADESRAPAGLRGICLRLEGLSAALTRGGRDEIEERTAQLALDAQLFRELASSLAEQGERADRQRELLVVLFAIDQRLAAIRELLGHAAQCCEGLACILAFLHQAHHGSQYSARGAPALQGAPRIFVQG
jgi:hypothetical protein